ncbi:hypothetical protein SP15_116 [Bacillus phage SP-15]|uniref:Macro domain-containing protein n=1 Tax=Bacillus phage SP-15 TaxID=1792032 RepID=A0A127AXC9_9CAUD|nr:phosphatase [Bacillus phage SP-15]AMM44914.1 hypothetical protein SP15_116 [Bacillus phage SP-15]
MIEVYGDAWSLAKGSVLCITSNFTIKRDGSAVLGAGIAKQARDFHAKGIDRKLGALMQLPGGKRTQLVGYYFPLGVRTAVVSFPVKHHWKHNADIDLIQKSSYELVQLANEFGWSEVYLPRPGCGNGKLEWSYVKSHIEEILDDRFRVVAYNREKE